MAVHLVVVRVDRVHRHVDAVGDVPPDRIADRARSVGGPDDGDGPRKQDSSDSTGVGSLFASLDAVEELIGVGELPVEVDDARVEAPLEWPAGLGEHCEHCPVVAEHLSGEPLDAVRTCDGGEVFEQQRGDPGALEGVVDHERCFGFVSTRPPFVARPGDELIVRLDGERSPVDHVDVGEVQQLLLAQLGFR